MKRFLLVLTALALVLGAAAVASAQTGTIGIAMPTRTSERWIHDGNNVKAGLEALGYKVDLQYAGDNIDEQIAQGGTQLGKDQERLLRLKTDLASGKSEFRYAGRTYTAEEVRLDLANRFHRYTTAEATLASLKEVRSARQKSLVAARQKLEAMLASRRQLQVEVENLEARLQVIAAAQAASNCQFDDSRLGRVKQLVSNLRTRLDVAEKLVAAEVSYQGEIPLDNAPPENIVEQVTEHFAAKR